MRELDCYYDIEVEASQINEFGILKPHAYQVLFADIASRHLNSFHLNADDTIKYGMAWALISLHLEILRPIDGCAPLRAQTWHSQTKGPYFRRELVFCDLHGNTVFHGSTFSVLLDMEKRSILRPKALPIALPEPDPVFTIEARPTRKIHMDFAPHEERKVYNSYIDMLGHVNNCRYGEFAYDTFTLKEKARLHQMKRMEIYFESELRPQDSFLISKAYDGNSLVVRGHNNGKDDTAFDIVMTFDGEPLKGAVL